MVLSGTLNAKFRLLALLIVCLERSDISSATQYKINEAIRVKEVRLIGANNENIGVVSIQEATRLANEADLDLVEVAPNSDPPVCRVMDFGKFLYEKTKKEREARRAQTKIEVKEIRLRPKTNIYHQGFKVKDARGWLEEGNKVRVRIRFRGREIDYVDLALDRPEEGMRKSWRIYRNRTSPHDGRSQCGNGPGPFQDEKEVSQTYIY